MGPGYLREHLTPLGLAHPTPAGRGGMLWVQSARLLAGRVQEEVLFLCGSFPLEHLNLPPPM